MKSLLAEDASQVREIIFNRCDDIEDLSFLKRNVKGNHQKRTLFREIGREVNRFFGKRSALQFWKIRFISWIIEGYGIWYLTALTIWSGIRVKTFVCGDGLKALRFFLRFILWPGRWQ